MNCGLATIAGAYAHRATELMKKEGLQSYKERRAHIASSEAHFALTDSPTRRTPSVKSKVTMPLQARSTLFGEGSPVTSLDQPSGSEEEATLLEASSHWVVHGHSWGPCPDPM